MELVGTEASDVPGLWGQRLTPMCRPTNNSREQLKSLPANDPRRGHRLSRMWDLLYPAPLEEWRGRVWCPRAVSGADGGALVRSDDPQLLHLVLE